MISKEDKIFIEGMIAGTFALVLAFLIVIFFYLQIGFLTVII